jgi:PTH1 family peptidyl-tRNA hydrolase
VWLIVGLGNPGEEYAKTRHNAGFAGVAHLAKRHNLAFSKQRAKARLAEGTIHGQKVVLAKPFTYMNLSGTAVASLCHWYKIDPQTGLLVIYDDLDLAFGTLRLRQRGSAGTHNGMKSIIGQLRNKDFARIRIGIGNVPTGWDTSSYVLGRFTKQEQEVLPTLYEHVADAAEVVLYEGITAAMNRYNGKESLVSSE